VGGAAQTKLIKKLGGGIRLALAQYRELAAFAQFASDLDDATKKQLERGKIVTELMKQAQYSPMSVAEMAITLFAVNNGFMDGLDVKKVLPFEAALQAYMRDKQKGLVDAINASGEMTADNEAALKSALESFKQTAVY
jgi:F-type H+-transporting ATPase subunit alpha